MDNEPILWNNGLCRAEIRALVQFVFLRRPLADLLQACSLASLDLIVLKGAALAETVYPRPSLRSFGDIDVLIRWEDAPLAHALLTGLGYAAEASAWADLVSRHGCEANFFRGTERGPVVVEVHTDLLNNALLRGQVSLDTCGLWQRSVPACLAGREARVLGPEDQILHLCLHLAGHYFAAPNSRQDIVRVCAVHPIDWPLFITLCRTAGAGAIGYCGLFAAASSGAAVPASVLEALAPGRNRCLLENLVSARIADHDAPGSEIQRFLLVWLMLDRARLSAVRHLFFPNSAWLHAHYQDDLSDAPGIRRLPLGVLLGGRHLGFLSHLCLRVLAGSVRKLFRTRTK